MNKIILAIMAFAFIVMGSVEARTETEEPMAPPVDTSRVTYKPEEPDASKKMTKEESPVDPMGNHRGAMKDKDKSSSSQAAGYPADEDEDDDEGDDEGDDD